MRQLEIIRQKRRYYMFSEKTRNAVLEVNEFFGKYTMAFEEKISKMFTYYDTPEHDLQKSNIVLFKTHIGKTCELNMATERVSSTNLYAIRTKSKHFSIPVKPHESPFKYKNFLIESFKSMFMSSINFDPEFLLKRLRPAYLIETISREYRSTNITGLKITYSFDSDKYTNFENKQVSKCNILTIYQHSNELTDESFEDVLGKLVHYCKELTPTSETKIMIARKMTRTKPVDLTKIKDIKTKKNKAKK